MFQRYCVYCFYRDACGLLTLCTASRPEPACLTCASEAIDYYGADRVFFREWRAGTRR